MKVFLDTNLFLDAMLQNRQFPDAPIEVLNLCSERKIKAYTSGINIANVWFMKWILKDRTVLDEILLLRTYFTHSELLILIQMIPRLQK